jgi:hypothetical protein
MRQLLLSILLALAGLGGAAAMWVVLSWHGETSEQADKRVAWALCEQIRPVNDPRDALYHFDGRELGISFCARQALAKLQFERRMRGAN